MSGNRIQILLIFIIFLSQSLLGQEINCNKFSRSLDTGDVHRDKKNYGFALKCYQDAMIAARECGMPTTEPAKRIKDITERLKQEKELALKSKQIADNARKKADTLLKIAEKQNMEMQSMALSNMAYIEIYKNQNFTKGFRYAQYAFERDTNNLDARNALYATIYEPIDKPKHVFSNLTIPNLNKVKSVIFRDSSKNILTIGDYTAPSIWNADSGKLIVSMSNMDGFTIPYPDENKILTIIDNNSIIIWDSYTGKELTSATLTNDLFCTNAVFTPDTKYLLTINGSDVEVWDIATWKRKIRMATNCGNIIISPDGKKIFCCDRKSAKILDAATGRIMDTILHNIDKFSVAVFSQDSRLLLMAYSDSTAKIYDLDKMSDSITLNNLGATIKSCVFTANKDYILPTFDNEYIKLINIHTPADPKLFNCNASSAFFSPDDSKVITVYKNTLKLWDINTWWTEKATLSGHSDIISDAGFSPDGKKVWALSFDGVLKMWDIDNLNEKGNFPGPWETGSFSVFSPDRKKICTILAGIGKIYDVLTGTELTQLSGNIDSGSILFYSLDSKKLLRVHKRDSLKIWDVSDGHVIGSVKNTSSHDSFLFSPGCDRVFEISKDTILLIDIERGILLKKIVIDSFSKIYLSADNKKFTTYQKNGKIRVWSMITGQESSQFSDLGLTSRSAVFSPGGDYIIDSNKILYFISIDKLVRICRDSIKKLSLPAFSPDNQLLFYKDEDDNTYKILNVQKGKQTGTIPYNDLGTVTKTMFSSDNKFLLTSTNYRRSILWRTDTLSSIANVSDYKEAYFSPDNRFLLLLKNSKCSVVDCISGKTTVIPDIKSAAFSPDGNLLLTKYYNSFKLWDTKNFEEIISLPIGNAKRFFFSTDSKKILAEYANGISKIWLIDTRELISTIIRKNKIDDLSYQEKIKMGIEQ